MNTSHIEKVSMVENRSKIKTFGILFIVNLLLFSSAGYAENIDSDNVGFKYAYGENVGWINFKPSFGSGVTVADSVVEGYAWGENIGWINLNPTNGGVVNNGYGDLSGFAWGETVGWISFSCKNTDSCQILSYGVSIDPKTGEFSGKAWGENIGWVSFDHSLASTCGVKTAWVGEQSDDGDSDGGGGGGCFIDTLKY
jgi:hypothetical protein